MALHLRENTNMANAMAALRQCAEAGRSLANAPTPGAMRVHVHNYLNWVEATEAQLRNVFASGLSLRCVWHGLQVIPMPEKYLRKRPAAGSPEAAGI